MFLTVHATTGIIIGQSTGNIWLAFLGGIFAHFLIDMIPHGDTNLTENMPENLKAKIMAQLATVDTIVMSAIIASLHQYGFLIFTLPIIFGLAGSIAPDFVSGLRIFFKISWLKQYLYYHHKIHSVFKKPVLDIWSGLVLQLIFLLFFLGWIIF